MTSLSHPGFLVCHVHRFFPRVALTQLCKLQTPSASLWSLLGASV